MRLPRLVRTSSFRLTLLYAALFSMSVLVLFGVVYWSTAGLMTRQIDQIISNELAELQANAPGGSLAKLQQVVSTFTSRSPGFSYLLQDARGAVLAGNMPPIKPERDTTRLISPALASSGGVVKGIYGRGALVAEDAYLFVGLRSFELRKMRQAIIRAFLLGLTATVVLALAGGTVMSLGLLRRVETIGRISHDIMAGDLGQRIALRGTNDEFDRLGAGLNAMLDRIQSLMDGLQQVSVDIAHDLRTPLTRLRHRLESARRDGASVATLQTALDGSIGDVDAILDTFGAVLRIAQIESGSRRAKFCEVDLSELLAGLVETYQIVAEEKGQTLSGDIGRGLLLEGDRELLTQLFSNLVENAITHAPPSTAIMISGSRVPDGLQIIFADNGPGIPPAYRQKVFQRFYRMEASRTSPGNGLGLNLAAAVAELHGASILLADNAPGLRATIVFPGSDG